MTRVYITFNPEAKCPKCGGDDIGVFYHGGWCYGFACWLKIDEEHLCRRCCRCQYTWVERCIDKEVIPAQA